MLKALKRLWKDDRGNILIIFGAALPLLVGAAGLASDTIQWTLWNRQLQRAADSGALAGVYDREAANGSSSATTAAVNHDLTINQHTWMALRVPAQVTFPANTTQMINQVAVRLEVQQRLPFSSLFLATAPIIVAESRAAAVITGGDACVEALDPSTVTGITFTGNSAIDMPDCDIFSNSAGTNSAIAQGSTQVKANSVGGVGGVQQSTKFTVNAYRPYSPALQDPFANVNPDPSQMNCGNGNVALTDSTDFSTLNGVNCFKSISVQPNRTLVVPPDFGPIYVNGGDADFKGNFTCTGCSIVMTNSDPASSSIGNFTANATTSVNITAPTSGQYQGIAIMQDRRASDCNNCNKINGNSGSVIQGAIYFPKQELQYNGTGNTVATCTMFVAKRINFSGNSSTSNRFRSLAECAGFGLPSNPSSRLIRLVA